MKQIEQITQGLWDLQDCSYRDFQAKLIPTLDKEKIIGVRTCFAQVCQRSYAPSPDKSFFVAIAPYLL